MPRAAYEFLTSTNNGISFKAVSSAPEVESLQHILGVADADGRNVRSIPHGRGWDVTSTIPGEENWIWRWEAL